MPGYKDWAQSANGGSLSMSYTGFGTSNDNAKCHDGNDGTSSAAGPVQMGVWSVTWTITLADLITLDTLRIRAQGGTGIGYEIAYYDTSWHVTASGNLSLSATWYGGAINPASNVSKVRCTFSGVSGPGLNNDLYTLAGWGHVYKDMGLRIRGEGGTIKIAVEDLDGHALRTYLKDTICGIPLVDPGVFNASSIRIYDGANVKALVDLDA